MKQVFRHTVFVLQLFVMEMKQMYIGGGGGVEELTLISRLYYQWGDRKVVKISKIVFHRFVQKWRLVAVSLFMSVIYVPVLN